MRPFSLWFTGENALFEEIFRAQRFERRTGLSDRLVQFFVGVFLAGVAEYFLLPNAGFLFLLARYAALCAATAGWIVSLRFKQKRFLLFSRLFLAAACLDAMAAGFSSHPAYILYSTAIRLCVYFLFSGLFLGILFSELAVAAALALAINTAYGVTFFFFWPSGLFWGDIFFVAALFFLVLTVARHIELLERKRFLDKKAFESQQEAIRRQSRQSARRVRELEEDVRIRSDTLQIAFDNLRSMQESTNTAHIETIHALSAAAEYKDEDTAFHILRMSHYSALLAAKLDLPEDEVDLVLHNSPMHDIGKMGIPDHILLKKGRLNKSEWELMKQHTVIGAKILSTSSSEFLETGKTIALSHHEKWDGTGYPYGLKGESIPLYGRICAVADVFDALTSNRPYKEAYSNERALDVLKKGYGTHFDPTILDIFFDNLDAVFRIQRRFSEKSITCSEFTAEFLSQKNSLIY